MSVLIDTAELSVRKSESPLTLETVNSSGVPVGASWERYLTVAGERLVSLGNMCDTCDFQFARLEDASENVSPREVADRLRQGVEHLDRELVQALRPLLPVGKYKAMLLESMPSLVRPGDSGDYFAHEHVELWGIDPALDGPHDPRTEYYRLPSLPVADPPLVPLAEQAPTQLTDPSQRFEFVQPKSQLFEFVVPLLPSARLNTETIALYEERVNAGQYPTAFAISVLDTKYPAMLLGEFFPTAHVCLTHYLLDGHHKTLASARQQRPLRLLSFLATGAGASTEEDVERVLDALAPSSREGPPGGRPPISWWKRHAFRH